MDYTINIQAQKKALFDTSLNNKDLRVDRVIYNAINSVVDEKIVGKTTLNYQITSGNTTPQVLVENQAHFNILKVQLQSTDLTYTTSVMVVESDQNLVEQGDINHQAVIDDAGIILQLNELGIMLTGVVKGNLNQELYKSHSLMSQCKNSVGENLTNVDFVNLIKTISLYIDECRGLGIEPTSLIVGNKFFTKLTTTFNNSISVLDWLAVSTTLTIYPTSFLDNVGSKKDCLILTTNKQPNRIQNRYGRRLKVGKTIDNEKDTNNIYTKVSLSTGGFVAMGGYGGVCKTNILG